MSTDRTTTDYDQLTDEELWNSPLGHRLRRYQDKLLAAEAERILIIAKRKWQQDNAIGVNLARDLLSVDGTLEERNDAEDGDPWAYWQSPEMLGLKEAIRATDGSQAAVQEAAKAYIASLQDGCGKDLGPGYSCQRSALHDGDCEPTPDKIEEPTPRIKAPTTPLGVQIALGRLVPTDEFAVHEADGFVPTPYVMMPVTSMVKVLAEVPEDRWQ